MVFSSSTYKCAVFLLVALNIYSIIGQNAFKVSKNGLNGVYTTVIKNDKFKDARLTRIYFYEYVNDDKTGDKKMFIKIEQFKTKKSKGTPLVGFYLARAKWVSENTYKMIFRKIKTVFGSSPFEQIELSSSGDIIVVNESYNIRSFSGDYRCSGVSNKEFEMFLMDWYDELFNRPSIMTDNGYIVFGKQMPDNGKRYQHVARSGIALKIKLSSWPELHNQEILDMVYVYKNMEPNSSELSIVKRNIGNLLEDPYFSGTDPLIFYFPNLKTIRVFDSSNEHVINVKLTRKFQYINFNVNYTDVGLSKNEEIENRIEERAIAKRNRVLGRQMENERIQRAKEEAEAKSGINPSGIVISVDNKPKGTRYELIKSFFSEIVGEGYSDKMLQGTFDHFNNISNKIYPNSQSKVDMFKSIYYGKFSDFRDPNSFGDLYNGFVYYANLAYGNDYYPKMEEKTFTLITRTIKKKGGFETFSDEERDFEVYMPKGFRSKFSKYLHDHQFDQSGQATFIFVMISFFEQYDPKSLAFKQMMCNLFNYAHGLPPVSNKTKLAAFGR